MGGCGGKEKEPEKPKCDTEKMNKAFDQAKSDFKTAKETCEKDHKDKAIEKKTCECTALDAKVKSYDGVLAGDCKDNADLKKKVKEGKEAIKTETDACGAHSNCETKFNAFDDLKKAKDKAYDACPGADDAAKKTCRCDNVKAVIDECVKFATEKCTLRDPAVGDIKGEYETKKTDLGCTEAEFEAVV